MFKIACTKLNLYILCLVSTLSATDSIPPTQPQERYVPRMGVNWTFAQKVLPSGKLQTLNSFQEERRATDLKNKRNQKEYKRALTAYKEQRATTRRLGQD